MGSGGGGGSTQTIDPAIAIQALEAAVNTWQDALQLDEAIAIELQIGDLGPRQLGAAVALHVDESGRPTVGQITIDDDGGGLGWHTDLAAGPATSHYDLFTVLLHEIGHVLGFASEHDGFHEHVSHVMGAGRFSVAPSVIAALDADDAHLDEDTHPGDLMIDSLAPGVRRLPSEVDVRILHAVYETSRFSNSDHLAWAYANWLNQPSDDDDDSRGHLQAIDEVFRLFGEWGGAE